MGTAASGQDGNSETNNMIAWNVLVLGDPTISDRFERYAKPGLATIYNDRRVDVHRAIGDQPFDAVILALDLQSFRETGNQFNEFHEAEKITEEHFGETIHRHIIILLGYDQSFHAPDNIPKYIEDYAPDSLKKTFAKYERRFVEMYLDEGDNESHIQGLKERIDEVTAENCGPFKHRIVLLGGRDSNKCNIGNLILNGDVFGNTEPAECVAEERVVAGKRVLVVNTPAVQPECNDLNSVNQMKISESLLLTSPGPRVFVMVISETERDDDISRCFTIFEKRFGTEAYSHLIVVFKQRRPQQRLPHSLNSRLKKFEERLIYHCAAEGNDTQNKILFWITKTKIETKKKELSLVLLGPTRHGKSHTANNLLGPSVDIFSTEIQQTASRVSVAMRSTADYDIVIADTPSLRTPMSDEEVLREIEKCAFFPDKRPRPIAVVLQCDRTLDIRVLERLQFIEKRLDSSFARTSIVLFTRKNYMEQQQMNFRDFMKRESERESALRTLLSACHWRCVAYENKCTKTLELRQQNEEVFTLVRHVMNPNPVLQLVLVGRTGSGKSASGNTIMSKRGVFNASFSQISNTEVCQVEEFKVAGRAVRLVDTPGLFDTRERDNKNTLMELCKCMLYTLPGPHVFLFVMKADTRFTVEMQESMDLLKQTFGDQILRHMVVIFTRLDELRRANRTVESIIEEIRQGGSDIGKEFFNTSGEYVAFDNRHGHRNGNEAKDLLEAAERVAAANGYQHFTNRSYGQIVQRLNWYGTGRLLYWRYTFEKHGTQFKSAVGAVADVFRRNVPDALANAFTAVAAYFTSEKNV